MKQCKHCKEDIGDDARGFQCYTCKNGIARYGMNKIQMQELADSQNNTCKLCKKEVKMFDRRKSNSGYVDHDHVTGEVRGILCHPCNTSLGYIERTGILNEIEDYLG